MNRSISIANVPTWDTRQLAALLAVVETGTFTGAAEQLGFTQSAVSQQIARLERSVGAPLLERPGGPRRVRLTPVGEALALHGRAVVDRLRAAQADIAAILAGERGTLRVGTLQSVGTKVLPRLLRRFRTDQPGIELVATEIQDMAALPAGVESGELDLSFVPLPLPEGPFALRRLLDDPYMFMAPAAAPEARQDAVSLRQVIRLPLIGLRDEIEARELETILRRTGTEPTFAFRSNDNPTIQGLVAAELGYAVLPRLTIDEDDPEIVVLPFSTPVPPRQLGIIWHIDRQLPAAASRFVELAAEVCDDLSRDWAATSP
jgi:DNA-binding transcriptional LysR family regulator